MVWSRISSASAGVRYPPFAGLSRRGVEPVENLANELLLGHGVDSRRPARLGRYSPLGGGGLHEPSDRSTSIFWKHFMWKSGKLVISDAAIGTVL